MIYFSKLFGELSEMYEDFIFDNDRVRIRPFCLDDVSAVYAYSSVPENVRFMPFLNDMAASRGFLERCEASWSAEPRVAFEYAVYFKPEEKVIGGCGLYIRSKQTAEIGWILNRAYWGRGLMPEAGELLLRCGFEKLGLHRIFSRCNTENTASRRVMEKLGMRREAHFVDNAFDKVDGVEKWHDEYWYGLLADEWRARQKS